MKELLPQIRKWMNEKRSFAIARVIQTWGSSPRPVGSALIISSDLEMAGSLSGGCVEGYVLKEARQIILESSAKKLSYGVSDDEAWSAGLTCGGRIQVYIESVETGESVQRNVWETLIKLLDNNEPCTLVTKVVNEKPSSTLIDDKGNGTGPALENEVAESVENKVHGLIAVGDEEFFIQPFFKKNKMLIIGAAHITVDLVQLAKQHDFETIVIDPRGIFADKTQFEVQPDELIVKYPSEVLNGIVLDGSVYAVILSHDPKIDDDALHILLRSNVSYIGALGSKKTHEKRVMRLKENGFSEEEINRIESPIGIDIQAQGAREIALSIMGSVVRRKNTL